MPHIQRMVHDVVPTETVAYRKHRTCERKKVYPSMGAGWNAVKSIQENGNDAYPDFELRPYECGYCGKIHVGHSNRPRTSEERLQAESTGEAIRVHGEVLRQSSGNTKALRIY